MQTVGDQIFVLTKEVKELRARCRQYEQLLREMAEEKLTLEQVSFAEEPRLEGFFNRSRFE